MRGIPQLPSFHIKSQVLEIHKHEKYVKAGSSVALPKILGTQAKIRRTVILSQSGQIVPQDPISFSAHHRKGLARCRP
jgi:hypothetical protein